MVSFPPGVTEQIEGPVGGRLSQAEGLGTATAGPMCHIMSSILRSTPAMSWMNLWWWVAETGLPSLAAASQNRRRLEFPLFLSEKMCCGCTIADIQAYSALDDAFLHCLDGSSG